MTGRRIMRTDKSAASFALQQQGRETMAGLPRAQLAHFGFHVRDFDGMVEFYSKVLGLVVTDSGDYYMGGKIAFMSRDPEEHHQLVVASGRTDDGSFKVINQISFKVESLEDLRTYYAWLVTQDVNEMNPRNHGNAWSIYFRDPEGNRIEIYTSTPWYVAQPFGEPLDLSEPAATIVAKTEALISKYPTMTPIENWSGKLEEKIRAADPLRN
jgi:catechol 2,3-dioxygenase